MWGNDGAWLQAAHALGLVLHDPFPPGVGFWSGASFAQLKRAMGAPAAPPPRSSLWMYGKRPTTTAKGRREVEVLVLVDIVTQGSSTTVYTHAIARVDPPLFVGLRVVKNNWLSRALSPSPFSFGEVDLDKALRLEARDYARAGVLLTSRGGPAPRLVDRLRALERVSFEVTDTCVDLYTTTGIVTSPAELGWRLDYAAAFAASLSEQEGWLPPDTSRLEAEGAWRAFADAERFTLDPLRMKMVGEVSGARVTISLESEPKARLTAVTVEMPRALGLGLRMKPQSSLQFIANLFGVQDIQVGDAAFDERFVIQGAVPEHVRAALANPLLRRAVLELAYGAADVRIDDAKLFFRYPLACVHESQLRGITARVAVAMEALFPGAGVMGPYR